MDYQTAFNTILDFWIANQSNDKTTNDTIFEAMLEIFRALTQLDELKKGVK